MKKLQKIISLIMILVMLFSLVGCAAGESKTPSTIDTDGKNSGALVVNGVEVKDAFVTLNVDTLEENEVSVEKIKIEDIIVNCVKVEEITVLETEVVSLNDEFVYLAYQNFVSYYDADFDFQKFLTDIAIGGVCIIVCVTLSVAGGPIGTFFGAVITSEFSTAALAISAAIDAAVSGYQAYQEGGDASYIVGHMLNGVADGFKWGAMLAPVSGVFSSISGAFSGIQAISATSKIRKLEGLADKPDQVIEALFKDYTKIIMAAEETDMGDAALKKLYKKMSKELSEETTEDVFILAVRNQADITDYVLKYHPFNVDITDAEAKMLRAAATKERQYQYLLKNGIPENKCKEIIEQISNGKSLDIENIKINGEDGRKIFQTVDENGEIKDDAKTRYEFLQLFGDMLSNEVCDDVLRTKWEEEVANAIKQCIAQSDSPFKAYKKLHEEIGYYNCVHLLSDPESLIVLKARFGSEYVDRLLEFRRWHQCIDRIYINNRIKKTKKYQKLAKEVDWEIVEEIVEGFRSGKYKTIDDVEKVSKKAAENLRASKNEVSKLLKESGLLDKNKEFLKDLARRSLKDKVKLNEEQLCEELVGNQISKNEIIEKYGKEEYDKLKKNFNQVVQCLTVQNTVIDYALIRELFADVLSDAKLSEKVINKILNGASVSTWGISDSKVKKIANRVAVYYLKTDNRCFSDFIDAVTAKKVQDGTLPQEAVEQLKRIMENDGIPSDGYIGGCVYDNKEGLLPKGVNYKEYDIYPDIDRTGRDKYRLVFGEDGRVYYTKDHYASFIPIV